MTTAVEGRKEGANKVLDAEEQLTDELFGTRIFESGCIPGEIHGDESDGDESDDGKTPGAQNGGGSLFYEDLGVSEEPTSTSVFTTTIVEEEESASLGKMKMTKTSALA